MLTLADCQLIINKQLNDFKLPELPHHLYEPIRYMLDLEAKRLRPSLVLMGCNVFSDDIGPAIYPALAIEVFHNFTLMHDDIMDRSAMRRNKPAVHVKWNPNIALLSGDAMLIKAYELITRADPAYLPKILPVFNKTALAVCEGQQYDMDYEGLSVSLEEYIRMIESKTAVLLASSLKMGALLGGAGDKESDCLYAFGKNIGITFQLQDDLLDVFADPVIFGKVTGNDIVSNKMTILLIEALARARGSNRKVLLHWLGRKRFNPAEKIEAVRGVYRELGVEQSVAAMIRHYYGQALENLESLKADMERKSALLAFSSYLVNRKK